MAEVYVDPEVEHAIAVLRANNGRARVGHKTRLAQGKISRVAVQRLLEQGRVTVRGPNVFLADPLAS